MKLTRRHPTRDELLAATGHLFVSGPVERPEVECTHDWLEEARNTLPRDMLEFRYYCRNCLERMVKQVPRAEYLKSVVLERAKEKIPRSTKSEDNRRYSGNVVVVKGDNNAIVIDGYMDEAPAPIWPATETYLNKPHKPSVTCECKRCIEYGRQVDEQLDAYRIPKDVV